MDKAKLKWWYKLVCMPEDRYPKQLFGQEWNKKLHRRRQRIIWGRPMDGQFVACRTFKEEIVSQLYLWLEQRIVLVRGSASCMIRVLKRQSWANILK